MYPLESLARDNKAASTSGPEHWVRLPNAAPPGNMMSSDILSQLKRPVLQVRFRMEADPTRARYQDWADGHERVTRGKSMHQCTSPSRKPSGEVRLPRCLVCISRGQHSATVDSTA
jgi:hypothetical protein